MDEKILKWYIKNVDEKRLREIIRYVDLNINGFPKNKRKKTLPPRVIISRSLENKSNINSLKDFFDLTSLNGMNENYKEEELIKMFKDGNMNEEIVEFIISTEKNNYLSLKELIVDEIEKNSLRLTYEGEKKVDILENNDFKVHGLKDNNKLEDKKLNLEEGEAKEEIASSIEESKIIEEVKEEVSYEILLKLKEEYEILKEKNRKKDEEIRKLREEKKVALLENKSSIKNLKKQINDLELENKKFEKNLKKLNGIEEKGKEQYNSLKERYDKALNEKRQENEENALLKSENQKFKNKEIKLKNEIKELKKEIELKEKEMERFSRRRIAIIGEIDDFHIKGLNYDFSKIDVKKIEDLDKLLNDYEEVWVLLYDLQVADQSRINRRENNYKVYKFKSFGELKNHMDVVM